MALGDGIRRNIASVDPAERALLRDALLELNHRYFPGTRGDPLPGGVTWWFKQDETHQSTHVHDGLEFVPWHREIVNRLETLLREINPQLSLHYWNWTQDPRNIPNANLGGSTTGTLNLFTPDFMGYGGPTPAPIGEPWLSAGFYVPSAAQHRDATGNAADPPQTVNRSVSGSPATAAQDDAVVGAPDYTSMSLLLEALHNQMHGFVNMGGQHISFRDPFVFLLHSNVDRLFAAWQTRAGQSPRLDPAFVYGTASDDPTLNSDVQPWSGGLPIRPWASPEFQGDPHTYKRASVVAPPCYDTNGASHGLVEVSNATMPPTLDFTGVPTGETAVRAAVFHVYGCGDVTVRVRAGAGPAAPFSVLHPASGTLSVHRGAQPYAVARFWVAFTAGAAGVAVPDGSVTFECPESGQTFSFVLKATAIARPTVAVMLALDQSGSMAWPAGSSGATRLEVLKDAARKFMELVPANNAVGLVRFDHDAYAVDDPAFPGLALTRVLSNNIFDPGRVAAIGAVNSHQTNVNGNTSVGDGVERARQVLNAVPAGQYDHKALVVLTDGLENAPLWLADVGASIDDRTFAIGLGSETQVDTAALTRLSHSAGGYLLLTGLLSASIDDYFRLSKYFLQILAGVTHHDIIVDPSGHLAPEATVRVPFFVNEADLDCTVLLLTDENVIELALEAPDGTMITETTAPGLGLSVNRGDQTRHFRFTLPVAIGAGQQTGTWYAVLKVNPDEFKKAATRMRRGENKQHFQRFVTHGPRYSVAVQTYSNLRFDVQAQQSSFEPGATLSFQATLSEYGLPVEKRAMLQLELTRPGGGMTTLDLLEGEPGTYQVQSVALSSGVYVGRVLARGVTLRGTPFTREQTVSLAVWKGGDQPVRPPRGSDQTEGCELWKCLLSEEVLRPEFAELMKRWGVDLDALRTCMKKSGHRHSQERTPQ
jgi:hypothetical protein